MKLSLKFFLVIFFTFSIISAQKLITHFEKIGLQEGLSQANINSIIQDKEGFIWIATQDGLNKYDGYKFTIYRYNINQPHSLSYNYIYKIFEDSDGFIWIGTDKGGINRFDKEKEKFIHFKNIKNDSNSIPANVIRAITEDKQGNLWFSSYNSLSRLSKKQRNQISNNSSSNNVEFENFNIGKNVSIISSLFCDSRGNIWIGSDRGLRVIPNDKVNNPEIFEFFSDKSDNSSLLGNRIYLNSIDEDISGNIWIGTDNGLNKFISFQEGFEQFSLKEYFPGFTFNVNAIKADSKGNLWIGTQHGLLKYNEFKETIQLIQREETEPHSLSSNSISVIQEDRGGNLWIGTHGSGINKLNYGINQFSHYKVYINNKPLSNNSIWSIFKDSKNNLWIGTDYNGAFKFDNKGRVTNYKYGNNKLSLVDNKATSICEDQENNIWIGTNKGLNRLIFSNGKHLRTDIYTSKNSILKSNRIRSIYKCKDNFLWVGTWSGGLYKISSENKNLCWKIIKNIKNRPQVLSNNYVRPIRKFSDGFLWVGTYNGLNVIKDSDNFTPKKTTWIYKNNNNPNSLTNDGISSILEDSDKNIWLGTRNGINKLDYNQREFIGKKDLSFKQYRESDGLINEVIYGLIEDNYGKIWCSSNKGLSRINPKNDKIDNYSSKDGLQSDEFNVGAYFKSKNGLMYFGGINGFNSFDPEKIKKYNYAPPAIITDFLLFNKTVIVSDSTVLSRHINFIDKITLDYNHYIFTLEFSVLNFRQPENNKFAYKLEGFHENWIETDYKNRRATFTDLSPGEYIFKVKAANSDGVWSEQETKIIISVLPPYYLTSIAKIFYLMFFIFAVFLLIKRQKRKIEAKQKELDLEKQFSEKLELYNRTLEEKVDERTKELKIATKNAEEANKLKTELLSIAAHDLKNPLNIILGFTSLIKNEIPDNSDTKIYLESIRKSSDDMLEIISKLIDSSAIETGEILLDLSSVNLNIIVDYVLKEYKPIADKKGQKLIYNNSDLEYYIIADSGRLKEIFSNLISNAIKYSPLNNEIIVTIYNEQERILIDIKDFGPGISTKEQKKLFKKFQKISTVPTAGESSTGLGLSITKKLIELQNGEIKVVSAPGSGSTFTVSFKIDEILKPELKSEEQEIIDPKFRNQKIIIADDLRENRKIIYQFLQHSNLTLLEVENGSEIIKLSNSVKPDLILCDINMPEMNGNEAAKILRKKYSSEELPIIAVTSLGSDKIEDSHFNEILLKPIGRDKLIKTITKYLQYD